MTQTGAPQQAAVAALAVGIAVIPYCFARAIEGMLGGPRAYDDEPKTPETQRGTGDDP